MCCVTLTRATFSDLLHAPHPSFVIPIFRAPTTLSPANKSTTRLLSTLLRQEQVDLTTTPRDKATAMINQQTFEHLILTNTIVAAFCIVLMIALAAFLLFLLVPSLRRRFTKNKEPIVEKKSEEISPLSQQPSFHHFTLGPSRLNPIFESNSGTPTTATTTTTTQFGTLFHPTTTATTLLHPTFWTPLTPTSLLSATPMPQSQAPPPTPPTPSLRQQLMSTPAPISSPSTPQQQQQHHHQGNSLSNSISSKPPLPSHPPTTASAKQMRKR